LAIEKSPVKENYQSMLEVLASNINEDLATSEGRTYRLVCFLADIINRYLDIELSRMGTNRTNYDILNVLAINRGSLTPTELCKHVFRSKHAITRAIDVLEAGRLVIRRPHDSPDRRLKKVNITEKGLLLLENLESKRAKLHHQFMSCFDEKEMDELGIPLRRLRDHLLKQINEIQIS
jgi:DNA-binding MarR family transcriptional regulator